jgi:hypothetical protein
LKPQNKITENQRQNGLSGGKKWLQQGATVQHPGAICHNIHLIRSPLSLIRSPLSLIRLALSLIRRRISHI